MAYTCSYCKTGVMNTPEQYLTHINGTKHKKKAFQLQAPDGGIEYDEFKKQQLVKDIKPFEEKADDFPSLTGNSQEFTNGNTALEFGCIRDNFLTSNRPIVVYEDCVNHIDLTDEDEFITVDDVFFKENSKIESARYIVNSYIKNQKTAAQALNEIGKAMIWNVEFEPVPSQHLRYAMAVSIDGIEFTIGEGENKKEAKQNAAAEAISEIKMKLRRKERGNPVSSPHQSRTVETIPNSIESPADSYQKISTDKYNQLERDTKRKCVMPKRFSAFIITERFDQNAKEGTIVAFGAGNGVNNKIDDLSNKPGYHLKNFDSLVLAKRSLQCFFYNQILLLLDKKRSHCKGEKIYFEIGKNGYITLKYGCRLHLYMSHAPKGDCVESIPRGWEEAMKLSAREVERDRCGNMDPIMYMSYSHTTLLKDPGHIRVLRNDTDDEWISLVNYRIRNKYNRDITMSPTDKLMAWIHLGIQGALLSHLMNPVYLYSIQFGKDYMHEHISRALLCRVPLENIISNRGSYYDPVKFFDPYIERVTEIVGDQYQSDSHETSKVCVNWYLNPVTDLPEIVDTKTGGVYHNSPYELPGGDETAKCSRLSKVCMLLRLKRCINFAVDYFAMRPEFQRTRYLQGINDACKYNYSSFKSAATDYRRLKQSLFESLTTKHYGEWLPNITRNEFNLLDYYDI